MIEKKRLFYLFIVLTLSLLTACRPDFSEDKSSVRHMVKKENNKEPKAVEVKKESPSQNAKEEPSYTFNAAVSLNSTNIQVEGDTTLPPGVILYVRLRAYPEDASLNAIKEYKAEPYMKVTSEDYMEVKGDGTFKSRDLERKDFPQRYLLELIFAPTRAEESVKQTLVKEGESVEDLAGMVSIDLPSRNEFFDDVVPGYIKHVNIMEMDEPEGDQVRLELADLQ